MWDSVILHCQKIIQFKSKPSVLPSLTNTNKCTQDLLSNTYFFLSNTHRLRFAGTPELFSASAGAASVLWPSGGSSAICAAISFGVGYSSSLFVLSFGGSVGSVGSVGGSSFYLSLQPFLPLGEQPGREERRRLRPHSLSLVFGVCSVLFSHCVPVRVVVVK